MSKALEKIMKNSLSYNEEEKAKFHRQAKKDLENLAKELGLQAEDYEVRSNMGGIAVSGEVTLHSKWFYVQVGQFFDGSKILFRTCKGMDDYTGGMNQYAPISALESGELVSKLKGMIN